MKQIKLEVGKTYRNRNGKEVRIVEKDGDPHRPCKGSDGYWYSENGSWRSFRETSHDLIEEIEEVRTTRHTFAIPDGVKKVTVEQVGNRIVVEMVPEKGPKPGDVMVNDWGSVYIFKSIERKNTHRHFAWLGENGRLSIECICGPGRPATPEEAQPLFDALKKAGKRWNPETMQVEDVPESERILEWVENNLSYGHHTKEGIAEAIEGYLKHKDD